LYFSINHIFKREKLEVYNVIEDITIHWKRSIDHIDRRQVVERHMAYGERTERTRKKKMRAEVLGWYEQ
jgi:hypothetical protein